MKVRIYALGNVLYQLILSGSPATMNVVKDNEFFNSFEALRLTNPERKRWVFCSRRYARFQTASDRKPVAYAPGSLRTSSTRSSRKLDFV